MSTAVHPEVAADPSVPLLWLAGIGKAFSGIPALRNAHFELYAGEVHAIAGENGAGKSTLIKIISGAYMPDVGTIEIAGRSFGSLTPAEARALGVAVVYQEFNLLPHLSVAENMFLGDLPRGRLSGYSFKRAVERARAILQRLGSNLDPARLVTELSVAEQQLAEIGAALALDAQIIILDEPSTMLDSDELDGLHDVVRRLRSEGRAVVYITHRLDEIFALADRVTVFKDGGFVSSAPTRTLDHDTLIRAMIGRDLIDLYPRRGSEADGPVLLQVSGLSVPGKILDASLSARAGEIVGVAGLGGSGKTTLCRAIVGLERGASGQVLLVGKAAPRSPRDAAQAGLVMVPEDRKAQGIFSGHSIGFNLTISALDRLKTGPLISRRKEKSRIGEAVADFGIRPPDPSQDVAKLSGGNQQKVILARWLSGHPRAIVLDEPTRGVDIGAKAEIYALIRKLAEAGAAIVIASSDTAELLGLCDRIAVFHQGRIVDEIGRDRMSEEAILRAATHSMHSPAQSRGAPVKASATTSERSARGGAPFRNVGQWVRRHAALLLIYAITTAIIGVACFLSPVFRDPGNLTDILRQSTALGLATIGQVFVMLAGGIDMSVAMIARVVGLGVAVAMTAAGIPPIVAVPLALAAGALLGFGNGVLVTRLAAQPFIATIGTMGILYGVALGISDGPTKMVPIDVISIYDLALGPLPVAVVAMGFIWLLAWWVLAKSRFGRGIYAVGGAPRVARLAGLNGPSILTLAYTISGLASAAAGIFLVARSGVGNPNMAIGLEFQSIVTAAIGGISLYGGRGSIVGAFGAVILVSVIANLFDVFQISAYFQNLALGLIVVVAVAIRPNEQAR